jgi:hypothetical protein
MADRDWLKFRVDYLTKKYMTKPGATPLVTISKESNCKPKGPATLNNRAKKPSKNQKYSKPTK